MKGKAKPTEKQIVSQVESKKLIEKKHKQISRAAGKLFSKKGYHMTTMRDISAASKINLSYLYKYISSKDDVLYLFFQQHQDRAAPMYQALLDSADENPLDQLMRFLRLSYETVHKFYYDYLTMYTESRHLEPDSLRAVLNWENEKVKSLEALIRRGMNEGCFKTKDPFMAANIIHYLGVIEPMRGWNFRDQYTLETFIETMQAYIAALLGVDEKTLKKSGHFRSKKS